MDALKAKIAHVHKDDDALTVMFENGRTLLFPGSNLPEQVPDLLEIDVSVAPENCD
jgi:hypothetical protein